LPGYLAEVTGTKLTAAKFVITLPRLAE